MLSSLTSDLSLLTGKHNQEEAQLSVSSVDSQSYDAMFIVDAPHLRGKFPMGGRSTRSIPVKMTPGSYLGDRRSDQNFLHRLPTVRDLQ